MRRRPTPSRAAACALVVMLAWGGRAAAQGEDPGGLEKARTELGELRYEDALSTLNKALQAGTSGPAATAQIYLLMGEVRASLGQRDEAEKAFQRALAIDPEIDLRKGVSPKISRPFRKARRTRRDARPLGIAHRVIKQDPPSIAVLVQSDSLGMVTGARIVYWTEGDTSRSVAGAGKDRIDLVLPRGASRFTAAGIDEHGNRLVELGSESKPLSLDIDSGGLRPAAGAASAEVAASPATPSAPLIEDETIEAESGTPIYASWILWGGVALGIGAAGTWAGLSARSALDDLDEIKESEYEYEYSQAIKVADRAEQRSLIANICFGAAGAAAIASTVLFIRSRGDSTEERAAVAPLLGHDQLGVAAWLRF